MVGKKVGEVGMRGGTGIPIPIANDNRPVIKYIFTVAISQHLL